VPERTISVLRRAEEAGLHVVVVTGRMVQSTRRVLEPVGLREPIICYQGAVVADADGTWLRHEPIPLDLARETLGVLAEEGYDPNVYVGDELYVGAATEGSLAYAAFQEIAIHEVGSSLAWLEEPPTKLVCVGEPDELDGLERRMKERLGQRLYISKSLPYFLEFAAPNVTKAAGLEFLAERMGFTREQTVSFGDGENDVELIEWAACGIAVENAHERVKAVADWVCPSAEEQGVAQVLEMFLDSRA